MTSEATGARDRGAHDVAARGHRRRAQLGLPLLLAARLGAGARARCSPAATPRRRWPSATSCSASARATRPRSRSCTAIGGERRLTEFELDSCPATRARGRCASATRPPEQFQLDVYGEVVGVAFLGASALGGVEPRGCGRAGERSSSTSRRVWREPDDGIWEVARAAAALHPLEGHGLGRVRPRGAAAERVRARGAGRALESRSATRSTTRSASAATTPSAHVHAVLRLARSSTRASLTIPLVGFLPGTDERVTGTIDAIERELGRDGLRLALLDGRDRRRPAGRRGTVPCLLVLAGQRARAQRPRRRGARAVRAAARPDATTSACWPRSTTSSGGGRSATSRRPSATWP